MTKANRIYEDLVDDLRYMRRNEGFSASRLRSVDTLVRVLGGNTQSFDDLKVRFVSAINALPDKASADVLLNAYGLLPSSINLGSLLERRHSFGESIGLKADALAKRENAAINELAILLLTARYTMSPLPFSPKVMPSNAALHERVEVTTLVKDRLWVETRERFDIISLVDNVDHFEVSSDIPAIVTSTCEAKAKTEPSSGGLRHRFYYDSWLMRGSQTELTFTMRPNKELADPSKLILKEETRAFHEPTLAAGFEVIFMGQKPRVIWSYSQLAIYERPSKPEQQQILDLGGGSSVQAIFTDLYGGLYAGIAWEW